MRLLLLADHAEPTLWEYLDRRKLEGVDIVLSCGDLPSEYLSFLTCFTYAPILYVHGNHDATYEERPPEGCECIDGRLVVCKGLRILGLGGSMRYRDGPHQYTESQMRRRVLKLVPQLIRHGGVDILLAHAPAYGIGDDSDLAHRGFQVFVDLIDRYHPAALVHGHVHQSYRYDFKHERNRDQTRVINAYGYYYLDL